MSRIRPSTIEKVRQAIAYAIPIEKIIDAVMFGRRQADVRRGRRSTARPARCGRRRPATPPTSPRPRRCWQASAWARSSTTHLVRSRRRRELRADRACCCRRASPQIGIKTTINKIPGANWRTELNEEVDAALYQRVLGLARLSGVLLHLVLFTARIRCSTPSSYVDKEMDGFIDGAREAIAVGDQGEIRHGRERLRRPRPSPRCRASRCSSRTSTSRCRRTSPATPTGSTARLDYRTIVKG